MGECRRVNRNGEKWGYSEDDKIGLPGSYGTVFAGFHDRWGKVAVKRVTRRSHFDGAESAALQDLPRHSNIVALFEHEILKGGDTLLCMELCDGSLAEELQHRKLDSPTIYTLFVQLVAAVHHMHSHGYVHRDLKTSNVLLSKANGLSLRVADLGQARTLEPGACAHTLTGTPYYKAPEALEEGRFTPAADVWSVGVILYEMYTNRVPFQGTSEIMIRQSITAAENDNKQELLRGVSLFFAAIIREVLVEDDKRRATIVHVNALLSPPVPPDDEFVKITQKANAELRRIASERDVACASVAALEQQLKRTIAQAARDALTFGDEEVSQTAVLRADRDQLLVKLAEAEAKIDRFERDAAALRNSAFRDDVPARGPQLLQNSSPEASATVTSINSADGVTTESGRTLADENRQLREQVDALRLELAQHAVEKANLSTALAECMQRREAAVAALDASIGREMVLKQRVDNLDTAAKRQCDTLRGALADSLARAEELEQLNATLRSEADQQTAAMISEREYRELAEARYNFMRSEVALVRLACTEHLEIQLGEEDVSGILATARHIVCSVQAARDMAHFRRVVVNSCVVGLPTPVHAVYQALTALDGGPLLILCLAHESSQRAPSQGAVRLLVPRAEPVALADVDAAVAERVRVRCLLASPVQSVASPSPNLLLGRATDQRGPTLSQ